MSPEREEYLRLKTAEGVHEMSSERREYLRLKGEQEPDTLGAMRFEPEVQPAVSTAVSPEYAEVGEPHFGILPKGTGERFEKALPQWPITEDLGVGQKALRTAGNLALGAAKFPVRFGTGLLEEPSRAPEALAKFVPSVAERVMRAIPGAPHVIPTSTKEVAALYPRYGKMLPPYKGEERKAARRELMEEPFDVALLAAPMLKGLRAPRIKAPKPKPVAAPVVEAVKAKKVTPSEKPSILASQHTKEYLENKYGIKGLIARKTNQGIYIKDKSEQLWVKMSDVDAKQLKIEQLGSQDFRVQYSSPIIEDLLRQRAKPTPLLLQGEKGKVVGKKEILKPEIDLSKRSVQYIERAYTKGEITAEQAQKALSQKDKIITSDPKNQREGFYKYTPSARQQIDKITWAKERIRRLFAKDQLRREKPTELGFMGVTPESMKALGEPVTKAMRSISASTSQMIKGVKAKPEIVKGVKVAKETMIEHDRFIRQSEATSRLLKRVTEKAVPKKDRQMLMVHAYEHKMKGKYWSALTDAEKVLVRSLAGEKAKLNQFIKENKVLEMMPESEKISHIFHHWIDPKTRKPFKAMYGRLSKGLPQAKQRIIPTYEAGIAKGMKPATQNLGELIGLEWESAMRAHQTRQMIKSIHNIEAEAGATIKLTARGKARPIRMIERWDLLEKQGLTEGYQRYSHYALDKPIIFRDGLTLKGPVGVHKEIFPHLQAYMENPTYNAFDNLISVSRSAKLGLSMFHAVSLAAQETALSLGKLVTGHPRTFVRRVPATTIPRGLKYRKEMGPVERLLYQEGLELFRHSEQMGGEQFFRGVGIPSKAGNILTAPVKAGRDFIFGVVQPGMKTAFAHDTFLSMLPGYLKRTGWTKETVIAAYNAGKTIPKEALACARQAVQMADGHFSGEHWRRSLLETNRFMVKAYFSPTAQTAWKRGLLAPTWQREHLLVAKNVAKSFMPDKLIKKMGLAEIHPAAKAEYRQYLYGAVAVIGAVDAWNLMTTKMMDGKSKHLWENPEGKGFAVRAPWNEPDYTVTDKNGKERTIRGGHAYIRPLKSLFEVAEGISDPFKKVSYKVAPYLSAIIAQFPNNKYRNYKGMKDIPERAMDFMFDTFEPIVISQLVNVAKGRKKWPAAVSPFFGMPVSKLKMPKKELAWEKKRSTSRTRQRPGARR